MSVEVQTPHDHKQFGINSSQFEEIVPTRDDLSSKGREMKKESDTEAPTDKENRKQRKNSKSNYSSDGNGNYEDDFEESETPRASLKKVPQKSNPDSSMRRRLSNSSRSPETSTTKSTSVLSRRSSRKFKKKFKAFESPRSSSPASSHVPQKSWGRPKNRSANVKLSRLDESVVDRVLSANRHKVQKLESRLSQLVKELTLERDENKTLRQIHYRQEKELIKVNSEEAELPRLLTKHTTEVKSLRERMRRLHEATVQKENRLNDQDKEILKLRDRCKHYKDLCEMKNLTERADLQKNLTQTQENLEKRDSEISKLQRNLNLKEKVHARHLKEEKDKLCETETRLKLTEENYNNLQDRFKEKEKQLDYTNIYQRQIVLKEKGKCLPESPPKMAALPAPKKTTKPKPKKANNITKNNNNNDKTEDKKEVEVNKKPDSFFLTAHSDTGSDKELDKNTGKEPEKDKQLSITDGGNVSNIGMSSFNKHKTVEEELAERNDRLRKEEFERSLQEEDERLKKEKEQWERKKKEEEEREERERAEREVKWREDSAKKAREEQEQRQESARRRREEEEKKKAEEAKQKEDTFFEDEELKRKKEQLLARLKAIDGENRTNENPYHETKQTVGKLEKNGLPPLGNSVISPPVSVNSDPDGVFGIPRKKPVLIGRGSLVKKSTPSSWLDDNNTNKRTGGSNAKRNDDFGFGNYSPSVSKKKSGDLDGRGRRGGGGGLGENGFDFGEWKGSGGGEKSKTQINLPFLSEDFGDKKKGDTRCVSPSNNEPLLPRRRRAQEKSGPVISSVFDDNLDDDIEELTL